VREALRRRHAGVLYVLGGGGGGRLLLGAQSPDSSCRVSSACRHPPPAWLQWHHHARWCGRCCLRQTACKAACMLHRSASTPMEWLPRSLLEPRSCALCNRRWKLRWKKCVPARCVGLLFERFRFQSPLKRSLFSAHGWSCAAGQAPASHTPPLPCAVQSCLPDC